MSTEIKDEAASPVVGVITFEVPNLDDCTADPQALLLLSDALSVLSAYAYQRSCAMRARLKGEIAHALQNEKACERYYRDLPEWARW